MCLLTYVLDNSLFQEPVSPVRSLERMMQLRVLNIKLGSMQQHAKDRTHNRQWSSCDANSEMERPLAKDAPKDRDLARSAVFEEDEIVPGCTQRPSIKPLIPNDGAKFMHRFAQGQQDPVDSAGGCQSPG